MKTAPQPSETVVVSDRVEPTLTLPIVSVIGYDEDHQAWQVGVRVACASQCETRHLVVAGSGTRTLWVQQRESWEFGGKVKQWRLYDIKQPLAAKASPA